MMIAIQILTFWFGDPVQENFGLWFGKSDQTDKQIEERFGSIVKQAASGELDHLAETAKGRLALIIMLDQFPRNIYRDTPQAFATDSKALALAKEGIRLGQDKELLPLERAFFYIPFEHSENAADQETSVALFKELGLSGFYDYALQHKAVIDKFGRYPHRNKILGRESTEAEKASTTSF